MHPNAPRMRVEMVVWLINELVLELYVEQLREILMDDKLPVLRSIGSAKLEVMTDVDKWRFVCQRAA